MTIAIESLRDTVRKILAPPPSGDKDISVAIIRRPGLVDDARAVAQGDFGAGPV